MNNKVTLLPCFSSISSKKYSIRTTVNNLFVKINNKDYYENNIEYQN